MAISSSGPVARNVNRISHLDLPGAGQVYVAGNYAYVGHIPNKEHLGTSIIDISDPKNPKVVSQITLDDHESHSHKARVVGDIMIVNSERNNSGLGRKAEQLPPAR
ncbi:RNA polymerase subunit sigma-70, partial [bacterium]|nr:RNA polymerase subunit sigma-70 [bacterium]